MPSDLVFIFPIQIVIGILLMGISIWMMYKLFNYNENMLLPLLSLVAIFIGYSVLVFVGTKIFYSFTNHSDVSSCNQNWRKIWNSELEEQYQTSLNDFCIKGKECPCFIMYPE